MPSRSPYAVLGVAAQASVEEIRLAYRRQVFRHHPDRSGTSDSHEFVKICEAYELLSDGCQTRIRQKEQSVL